MPIAYIRRLFVILQLFFVQFGLTRVEAQIPTCINGGPIYICDASSNSIYNFDPTLPTGPTNPILNTVPSFPTMGGLAVLENINGAGTSPTFYVIDNNGFFHYYNGTNWIATGHFCGSGAAINIGGGGGAIYCLEGFTGNVYKYNGTGNGVFLMTIPNFAGPYDLVGSCDGTFYAASLGPASQILHYSATGALLNTITVTGIPSTTVGPGFAIIGNQVYVDVSGVINVGTITGSTLNFNTTITLPASSINAGDYASCPVGSLGNTLANLDTAYICAGDSVLLSAGGPGPFSWTVVSGPVTLSTNTGPSVYSKATAAGVAKIAVSSATANSCSSALDTITVLVPQIVVSAGPDDTIYGCGTFSDTLHATVTPNIAGLPLVFTWSPSGSILSGGNTLDPIIVPGTTTSFTLTVSLDTSAQSTCSFSDDVLITPINAAPSSGFTYDIQYGCTEDTVYFTNTTTNYQSLAWDFADGSGDTATNPIHIYSNQNTYNVKFIAANQQCSDSILVLIDTRHALSAAFTIDNDSVCQGTIVNFANASNYSTLEGPAKFLWSISDGTLDTNLGFAHLFPNAGLYEVRLIVTDFVPCSDTAYGQMQVDSASNIAFTVSGSTLCEGQNISFVGNYYEGGLNNVLWDFGDGTQVADQQQVQHAFDSAGVYSVSVSADYRLCPDPSSTRQILVNPFPSIKLGPDTSICPGDAPIVIRDLTNFNNPAAIWTWNTGDSGVSSIAARHPGIYTARVSVAGCATSDSVFVRKDCFVNVPNSFTPNSDGENDHFLPRQLLSQGVASFVMKIYNRWGQEVFSTSQIDGRGWDGKFNDVEQPTGVYIYTLEAVLKSGLKEKSQGNVTLLR